ncbi:FlgO family outer membrane protein [Pseudoalteromonas sp. T1lg48]|uniref:FlgO family outer membrane protein n=1 Tax=Pseudoalteromonas sp. T1lg48 TaxID=2077100 RepID=UPI000CF6B7E3|nr:FlgO family outer membrane protein [Pseudoalteromonas sp. T1lg48]
MMRYLILSATLALTACAQSQYSAEQIHERQLSAQAIHGHTQRLAEQLLARIHGNEKQQGELVLTGRIAVGTFLPIKQLAHDPRHPQLHDLGLQLQDGLVTLMTQAGFEVVDFKQSDGIYMQMEQDKMLSRDVMRLSQRHNLDYYLTGTLLRQEDSYVVNARLIKLDTQQVVAAATDYIPANVMWSEQKTVLRHGQLYRNEY